MDLLLDRSGSSMVCNEHSNSNYYSEQFGDEATCDENYVEIKVDWFCTTGNKPYFMYIVLFSN